MAQTATATPIKHLSLTTPLNKDQSLGKDLLSGSNLFKGDNLVRSRKLSDQKALSLNPVASLDNPSNRIRERRTPIRKPRRHAVSLGNTEAVTRASTYSPLESIEERSVLSAQDALEQTHRPKPNNQNKDIQSNVDNNLPKEISYPEIESLAHTSVDAAPMSATESTFDDSNGPAHIINEDDTYENKERLDLSDPENGFVLHDNADFEHCPGKVSLKSHRSKWLPWQTHVSVEKIDGKKPASKEAEDPLPIEADDVIAAAAGHNLHPGPIITPLFTFAGLCAIFSTYFGIRTAVNANKNIPKIAEEINKGTATLKQDTLERQQHEKTLNSSDSQSSATKLDNAIANTNAYLKERKGALAEERHKRWSSLLMSFGTGIQSLGILASGAMLGGITGIAVASPFLLGAGLLAVGAFATLNAGRGIHQLLHHRGYTKNIDKQFSHLSPKTVEQLKNWHKTKQRLELLKTSGEAALAVGAISIGLTMIGLFATPVGWGMAAVGLVAFGVGALLTHHFAHKKAGHYQHMHGSRKRNLGTQADIANRIMFSTENRDLMLNLKKQPGTAFERLSWYLAEEAHLRGKYKPTSPHSYDLFTQWRPSKNHHENYNRLREYLHRQNMLKPTMEMLYKEIGHQSAFRGIIKHEHSYKGGNSHKREQDIHINLSRHDQDSSVTESTQIAFEEAFAQAALEVIIKDGSKYRQNETRELLDHLMMLGEQRS